MKKISNGLKAGYTWYRVKPFDLVIRERLVGCTLVLTRGCTPSIQIWDSQAHSGYISCCETRECSGSQC